PPSFHWERRTTMDKLLASLAMFGLGMSVAAAQTAGITTSNSSTCGTVTLKSGESPPMATPMGALPRGGANADAGQIPTTSHRADGSTVVVDATGKCTVYQREGR